MKLSGKAIRYGDHVDTDAIIAARYMNTADPTVMAAHAMEDYDPRFHERRASGCNIIVAGANFGCGSSREHAPVALKAAGVACVIAASFARIFYRNAVNIGLPILESPEASAAIADGDEVTVDLERGIIAGAGGSWPVPGDAVFIREILSAGGLVELVRRRLQTGS